MTTSVSSEDNLDWAGDTGAQSGGGPDVDWTGSGLSGLSGLIKPFKGLFDKLTSGNATPSDYAAATGLLSMLLPGAFNTKTAGWKGSIDMNRPFTRTPIAQPAYVPYAGGAAPVMGRQFFTSSYGVPAAAPAPAPAPTAPEPAPPAQDPNASPGAAAGGLMQLARGGRARRAPPPRYLRGETDGMADKLPSSIDGRQPAKLSHGEFVIPADVVSHLGNGNSDAGAKVLYKMMDRVRQARTGTKQQGKEINPEKFTPGGVASGYAGGGAVAFSTGALVAGAPTTAPAPAPAAADDLGSTKESNISSWAGPYVGDMLSKTAALTASPYQAYQGPLVAGTSPLQSKVFEGLGKVDFPGQIGKTFSSTGAYQLPTMTATGATPGAPTGPTGIAAQYMNPYLSAVLTPQLEELRRQSQITQMGTAGKLAQAGAYGGSRQAIMDAEAQRNLLQEQNKTIGAGYASAYDKAMGQFNTEQQQARTLADMIAGAGQQQRGIEQEGITALQKQYETELLDPYTKLRFQKEMLQGLPVATEAVTPNTNLYGQVKGGLSDLQALLEQLGIK